MFAFARAVLGMGIVSAAAVLAPGGEPFTNFWHFVAVGYFVIGAGLMFHGVLTLGRQS